jgi:hypothetical protein
MQPSTSTPPRMQPSASTPPRTQPSASTPPRTHPSGAPAVPSRPASLPPPAAAAFARSPNVPIPSSARSEPPPADDDRAYLTDQAYGEDLTTLSRSLKVEQLGHQLYRAVEPPPSSGPNAMAMATSGPPVSMPASSGWPNAEMLGRVPSTERAVLDSPVDPLAVPGAPAKRRVPIWIWIAIGLTLFGAIGGAIAAFVLR